MAKCGISQTGVGRMDGNKCALFLNRKKEKAMEQKILNDLNVAPDA